MLDSEKFVCELQDILYYVERPFGRWDPDKPWDADVLDQLSQLMERYGLVPRWGDNE